MLPSDILAVAVDAATHTWVMCDKDFHPIRPAIFWTDSRSREQAQRLKKEQGQRILELTFHKPDTLWTLPQILWVQEHEPDSFAKLRYIFFEKDYIRHCLTGTYCTDYIEAQGSMLFDYNTMSWSKELCDLLEFPVEKLPELKRPTDIIGSITEKAAKETGLKAGTPVLCGATDTVMEVYAAGAVKNPRGFIKSVI